MARTCATTLPFDPTSFECTDACANFAAFGSTGSCGNPYAEDTADCVLGCDTIKATTPYSNAFFGCAAMHSDCAEFKSCVQAECG